jgi:hypothetical protein
MAMVNNNRELGSFQRFFPNDDPIHSLVWNISHGSIAAILPPFREQVVNATRGVAAGIMYSNNGRQACSCRHERANHRTQKYMAEPDGLYSVPTVRCGTVRPVFSVERSGRKRTKTHRQLSVTVWRTG